jgi:hypothetical protein
MGYTTNFTGEFTVTPTLVPEHIAYLKKFNETRRMKRNPDLTKLRPDTVRIEARLPVGADGGYFVGALGDYGQEATLSGSGTSLLADDIVDQNSPSSDQPGLWCQWVPDDSGEYITWDGGEKFYHYVEWISYLIEHFLGPWGYTLNGSVYWQGEDSDDIGEIFIENSLVRIKQGRVVYD